MTRILQPRFLVAVLLIALAALYRMVPYEPSLQSMMPYWWNLAPIGAMALFAGACISNRFMAFLIPAAALVFSDIMIGNHYFRLDPTPKESWTNYVFYPGIWVNYASFGVYVLIGFWLSSRRRVVPIGCSALVGSIQFFIVSNFGVWALGSLYPQTWAGLLECYERAIPFSRGTFIGDQVFAFALFGAFALVEWGFPKLREPALQAAQG